MGVGEDGGARVCLGAGEETLFSISLMQGSCCWREREWEGE